METTMLAYIVSFRGAGLQLGLVFLTCDLRAYWGSGLLLPPTHENGSSFGKQYGLGYPIHTFLRASRANLATRTTKVARFGAIAGFAS